MIRLLVLLVDKKYISKLSGHYSVLLSIFSIAQHSSVRLSNFGIPKVLLELPSITSVCLRKKYLFSTIGYNPWFLKFLAETWDLRSWHKYIWWHFAKFRIFKQKLNNFYQLESNKTWTDKNFLFLMTNIKTLINCFQLNTWVK